MEKRKGTYPFSISKSNSFILLVLIITLFPCLANARDTNWHPLFGKNLSRADYDPDVWFLKGNILHSGPYECIWSMQEYNSFELDMEFNNEEGASSHLLICCPDRGDWINNSIQIVINDICTTNEDNPSEIVCGSIIGHSFPVRDGIAKKSGEWNHLRVRYAGGRLSVILNGRKVTDGEINAPDTPRKKGFIGIEGYRGEPSIIYRNIRIREVKDPESGSSSNKRERENDSRVFPQY